MVVPRTLDGCGDPEWWLIALSNTDATLPERADRS